ncbi:hypothetical protein COR50_10560 [Chitinophaga caeni]|uniref:DUF4270 domain-containing protein n=1 Tax=Chitinophaga caeni TaxID=2029983 RepID=A0A291QUM7_9BACT|nr:DUF4270 family protein [Chitinophaga caeni]ATL47573.1 hypothetical protein COR50_10560 [Chitinophaga caeni]
MPVLYKNLCRRAFGGFKDVFRWLVDKIDLFAYSTAIKRTRVLTLRSMFYVMSAKRSIYQILIFLALALIACEKEGFKYNTGTNPNESNYLLIDTLTVEMRTIQLDSFVTSGSGYSLVGQYQDPEFGKIASKSLFHLALPADKELDSRAEYDSIELILKTGKHFYGDTSQLQTLNVYQLAENITIPDEAYALYNTSQTAIQSNLLGNILAYFRPTTDTLIHIKLAASLGQTIFDMIKEFKQEVSDDNQFKQYFKGLALVPGNANTMLMNFLATDSGTVMRLHYHENKLDLERKYLDFSLSESELQYNHIDYDRTGTDLTAFSGSNDIISSEDLENKAFLQYISGLVVRLDIPSLKTLPQMGKFGKIMSAMLYLQPEAGTYNDLALPAGITLCYATKTNAVEDSLVSPVTGNVMHGDLTIDKEYHINTQYSYDITSYCSYMTTADDINYRGLLLLPNGQDIYANRAVFGDKANSKNKVSLKVYYLLY